MSIRELEKEMRTRKLALALEVNEDVRNAIRKQLKRLRAKLRKAKKRLG